MDYPKMIKLKFSRRTKIEGPTIPSLCRQGVIDVSDHAVYLFMITSNHLDCDHHGGRHF